MFLIRSIILSLSVLLSLSSQAQDWYQIEVIIFEHSEQTQAAQSQENWPNDLELEWPEPLIELEPAVEREQQPSVKPAFEELVFDERNMNNDSYAIRVRDAYELLWHKAWRAPLLPEDQAPWILVQAGEQLGDHYRLEGGIRIHLSRYLHLHTDLWLTEVTGDPIIEEHTPEYELSGIKSGNVLAEMDLNQLATAIDAEARFDWSQLPEVENVRWGCNHIRETWPEDLRLLPADFYDDPAPAEWYYPFGCSIPKDNAEQDLPAFASYPTSDRYIEAELERIYPELFVEPEIPETPFEVFFDNQSGSLPQEETITLFRAPLDTEELLNAIEVELLPEIKEEPEMLFAPKVRYQVEEIVHIQDQRRMRSSEHHYIDHPKIGLLAVIYPVEKPDLVLEEELLDESAESREAEIAP